MDTPTSKDPTIADAMNERGESWALSHNANLETMLAAVRATGVLSPGDDWVTAIPEALEKLKAAQLTKEEADVLAYHMYRLKQQGRNYSADCIQAIRKRLGGSNA